MYKIIFGLLSVSLFSVKVFAQEFSDPSRTETKNDAGLKGTKSGFFQTSQPTNFPPQATSWWHLLDVRHTTTVNNFAMQFAGSFFDQNLFFRKTNDNGAASWSKVILETLGKVGFVVPMEIDTQSDWNNTSYMKLVGSHPEPQNYNLTINKVNTDKTTTHNYPTFDFNFDHRQFGGINGTQLSLKHNGDVGIGGGLLIQDANGYLLGGSIKPGINGLETIGGNKHIISAGQEVRINAPFLLAKKIKVSVKTEDWADYVFESNYNLRSLTSVENYISKHKHLPDVPSGKEVEKNDLDLGASQVLLLKKIEELTLYLIQQDKINQKQQQLIVRQQEMLQFLKKKIENKKK